MCTGQQTDAPNDNEVPVAPIVGFVVVLTFLVITISAVILLCACFGKCKLPCKTALTSDEAAANSSHESQRHTSNKRRMIPLPSPRVVNPSSSTQQERPNESQRLPLSHSFTSPPLILASPPQPRSKYKAEPIKPLVSSFSSPNVVHLRQLNTESFNQFAAKVSAVGESNPSRTRPGGSGTRLQNKRSANKSESHHTLQQNSDSGILQTTPVPLITAENPTSFEVRSGDRDVPPPLYPSVVSYPYQPYKSPRTPNAVALQHTTGNLCPKWFN